MMTAIDFGKEFLECLFHRQDMEGAQAFLAEDIVWISPDSAEHLRTADEVSAFLTGQVAPSLSPAHVDVVSIKSPPCPEEAVAVLYEINVVPKGSARGRFLRASLSIRRTSDRQAIHFVHMSEKHLRTAAEQVSVFGGLIPCGLMLLSVPERGREKSVYANGWFAQALGLTDKEVQDKLTHNPLFMLGYEQQKSVRARLAALRGTEGMLSEPVSFAGADGREIHCHLTASPAYREDGAGAYYCLFHDVTELCEQQNMLRRQSMEFLSRCKALELELRETKASDEKALEQLRLSSGQEIDELRRSAAVREEEMQRDAETTAANREKLAAAQVRHVYEEELAGQRAEHEEQIARLGTEHEEEVARLDREWRARLDEAGEAREKDRSDAAAEAGALRAQIAALEFRNGEEAAKSETLCRELEERTAEIGTLQEEIGRMREELTNVSGQKEAQDQILRLSGTARAERSAESEKALRRLERAVAMRRDDVIADMTAQVRFLIGGSTPKKEEFAFGSCMDSVVRLAALTCRDKMISFRYQPSDEKERYVGDRVMLQLVLLNILEFAAGVDAGSRKEVVLSCTADRPVRGRTYVHFHVRDYAGGIREAVRFSENGLRRTGEMLGMMGGGIRIQDIRDRGSGAPRAQAAESPAAGSAGSGAEAVITVCLDKPASL